MKARLDTIAAVSAEATVTTQDALVTSKAVTVVEVGGEFYPHVGRRNRGGRAPRRVQGPTHLPLN